MSETWAIARFTVLMALLATALVLPPAIAIGWLLARKQFAGKTLLETIVSLPLVLPPVATGLLLLWLFGRRSPLGQALDAIGIEVIFTWKAVVIAMMVISFPLVARSARAGISRSIAVTKTLRRRSAPDRSASCEPSRCLWHRAVSRRERCLGFHGRWVSLARRS